MNTLKLAAEMVQHERLAAHEAGHAAAALLLGLDVEEVEAPFATLEELGEAMEREGEQSAAGSVSFRPPADDRALAIAALMGRLVGRPGSFDR